VPIHASPPRSARRAARILVTAITVAGLSLVAPFFVKAASASETQLTVFLNGEGGIESVISGTGAAVSPSNGGPSDVVSAS
jgi:hypothetical protein